MILLKFWPSLNFEFILVKYFVINSNVERPVLPDAWLGAVGYDTVMTLTTLLLQGSLLHQKLYWPWSSIAWTVLYRTYLAEETSQSNYTISPF